MPNATTGSRWSRHLWNALVEIGFIMFLFYSNLLMGEFSRSSHKTFGAALYDVLTPGSLAMGLVAAIVGYPVVEFLRKRV